MPTANERKALWFLAIVALSGSGVRVWRARSPRATTVDAAAISQQIARVDSARVAGARPRPPRRVGRVDSAQQTSGTTRTIDLDRATPQEIEGLPGIGPALARRIVAHRDSAGPFGTIDALCDVRGVGPALVERLRPLVTFSSPQSPVSVACDAASKKPPKRPPRGTLKRS